MVEIKAPQFPESIADGEVAVWHVAVGEAVRRDQVLVDIETDKVVLEVVAPLMGHSPLLSRQKEIRYSQKKYSESLKQVRLLNWLTSPCQPQMMQGRPK